MEAIGWTVTKQWLSGCQVDSDLAGTAVGGMREGGGGSVSACMIWLLWRVSVLAQIPIWIPWMCLKVPIPLCSQNDVTVEMLSIPYILLNKICLGHNLV